VGWRGAGGKEVYLLFISQLKINLMEWEFINSVTIQLAKILFENLGCNEIKMKDDILSK
jgi:hypothetical protein